MADIRDLNVKRWIILTNNREKWASVVKEAKVGGGPKSQELSKYSRTWL
jgi:hypothetical protein